jgi:hypothetical protein
MTFDDNQFSVVLDKGTFDALMSNKSQQVGEKYQEISLFYFGNIGPGRYRSNAWTN